MPHAALQSVHLHAGSSGRGRQGSKVGPGVDADVGHQGHKGVLHMHRHMATRPTLRLGSCIAQEPASTFCGAMLHKLFGKHADERAHGWRGFNTISVHVLPTQSHNHIPPASRTAAAAVQHVARKRVIVCAGGRAQGGGSRALHTGGGGNERHVEFSFIKRDTPWLRGLRSTKQRRSRFEVRSPRVPHQKQVARGLNLLDLAHPAVHMNALLHIHTCNKWQDKQNKCRPHQRAQHKNACRDGCVPVASTGMK